MAAAPGTAPGTAPAAESSLCEVASAPDTAPVRSVHAIRERPSNSETSSLGREGGGAVSVSSRSTSPLTSRASTVVDEPISRGAVSGASSMGFSMNELNTALGGKGEPKEELALSHLLLLPSDKPIDGAHAHDGAHAAFVVTNTTAHALRLTPTSDLPLLVTAYSFVHPGAKSGAVVGKPRALAERLSNSSDDGHHQPLSEREPLGGARGGRAVAGASGAVAGASTEGSMRKPRESDLAAEIAAEIPFAPCGEGWSLAPGASCELRLRMQAVPPRLRAEGAPPGAAEQHRSNVQLQQAVQQSFVFNGLLLLETSDEMHALLAPSTDLSAETSASAARPVICSVPALLGVRVRGSVAVSQVRLPKSLTDGLPAPQHASAHHDAPSSFPTGASTGVARAPRAGGVRDRLAAGALHIHSHQPVRRAHVRAPRTCARHIRNACAGGGGRALGRDLGRSSAAALACPLPDTTRRVLAQGRDASNWHGS